MRQMLKLFLLWNITYVKQILVQVCLEGTPHSDYTFHGKHKQK